MEKTKQKNNPKTKPKTFEEKYRYCSLQVKHGRTH